MLTLYDANSRNRTKASTNNTFYKAASKSQNLKKVLSTSSKPTASSGVGSSIAAKSGAGGPDIDSLVAKFTNMAVAGNMNVQVMNNSKSRNSNAGVAQSFKTTSSVGGSLIANKYTAK